MLELGTVLEQIAAKRVELRDSPENSKTYDAVLDELNQLLIYKGKLT